MWAAMSIAAAAAAPMVLVQTGCNDAPAKQEPPPPKVTVAKPELRNYTDYEPFNGWMKETEKVEVRSRVRGHLLKPKFTDGELVERDQPLFDIDPVPFQIEIDRAKEQVKIYEAEANAAHKEEVRLKDLLTKGGASKSQVEAAEAKASALDAEIESAKQEVKRREQDLSYSHVKAPIAGQVGKAELTEGNLVNAGGTDPVLTTIRAIDPIYVYFYVDERKLQQYDKNKKDQGATRPAKMSEVKIPMQFGLETEIGYPHSGMLDFADNEIETTTGTRLVRGKVDNKDGKFIPGSRVRVRVPVSEGHPVVLVPDDCILADQDKRYVLVIDDKKVVQRRDVELGKLLDDGMRIVRKTADGSGVSENDTIIVRGIQMARINYPVDPVQAKEKPAAPSTAPVAASALK